MNIQFKSHKNMFTLGIHSDLKSSIVIHMIASGEEIRTSL